MKHLQIPKGVATILIIDYIDGGDPIVTRPFINALNLSGNVETGLIAGYGIKLYPIDARDEHRELNHSEVIKESMSIKEYREYCDD